MGIPPPGHLGREAGGGYDKLTRKEEPIPLGDSGKSVTFSESNLTVAELTGGRGPNVGKISFSCTDGSDNPPKTFHFRIGKNTPLFKQIQALSTQSQRDQNVAIKALTLKYIATLLKVKEAVDPAIKNVTAKYEVGESGAVKASIKAGGEDLNDETAAKVGNFKGGTRNISQQFEHLASVKKVNKTVIKAINKSLSVDLAAVKTSQGEGEYIQRIANFKAHVTRMEAGNLPEGRRGEALTGVSGLETGLQAKASTRAAAETARNLARIRDVAKGEIGTAVRAAVSEGIDNGELEEFIATDFGELATAEAVEVKPKKDALLHKIQGFVTRKKSEAARGIPFPSDEKPKKKVTFSQTSEVFRNEADGGNITILTKGETVKAEAFQRNILSLFTEEFPASTGSDGLTGQVVPPTAEEAKATKLAAVSTAIGRLPGLSPQMTKAAAKEALMSFGDEYPEDVIDEALNAAIAAKTINQPAPVDEETLKSQVNTAIFMIALGNPHIKKSVVKELLVETGRVDGRVFPETMINEALERTAAAGIIDKPEMDINDFLKGEVSKAIESIAEGNPYLSREEVIGQLPDRNITNGDGYSDEIIRAALDEAVTKGAIGIPRPKTEEQLRETIDGAIDFCLQGKNTSTTKGEARELLIANGITPERGYPEELITVALDAAEVANKVGVVPASGTTELRESEVRNAINEIAQGGSSLSRDAVMAQLEGKNISVVKGYSEEVISAALDKAEREGLIGQPLPKSKEDLIAELSSLLTLIAQGNPFITKEAMGGMLKGGEYSDALIEEVLTAAANAGTIERAVPETPETIIASEGFQGFVRLVNEIIEGEVDIGDGRVTYEGKDFSLQEFIDISGIKGAPGNSKSYTVIGENLRLKLMLLEKRDTATLTDREIGGLERQCELLHTKESGAFVVAMEASGQKAIDELSPELLGILSLSDKQTLKESAEAVKLKELQKGSEVGKYTKQTFILKENLNYSRMGFTPANTFGIDCSPEGLRGLSAAVSETADALEAYKVGGGAGAFVVHDFSKGSDVIADLILSGEGRKAGEKVRVPLPSQLIFREDAADERMPLRGDEVFRADDRSGIALRRGLLEAERSFKHVVNPRGEGNCGMSTNCSILSEGLRQGKITGAKVGALVLKTTELMAKSGIADSEYCANKYRHGISILQELVLNPSAGKLAHLTNSDSKHQALVYAVRMMTATAVIVNNEFMDQDTIEAGKQAYFGVLNDLGSNTDWESNHALFKELGVEIETFMVKKETPRVDARGLSHVIGKFTAQLLPQVPLQNQHPGPPQAGGGASPPVNSPHGQVPPLTVRQWNYVLGQALEKFLPVGPQVGKYNFASGEFQGLKQALLRESDAVELTVERRDELAAMLGEKFKTAWRDRSQDLYGIEHISTELGAKTIDGVAVFRADGHFMALHA
jgi:hypothetical protein